MTNTLNISLNGISFHFTSARKNRFFSDVSTSFEVNKIHFIRGKNGAGKSTLFRLMNGTIFSGEYIKGTFTLDGTSYNLSLEHARTSLKEHVRQVPQKFDLMLADNFSFEENLSMANMPRLPFLAPLAKQYSIPDFLVDQFEIDFTVPVRRLSGGQRQILAILMALQKPTKILLLDEPTAALDHKNARMVIHFLQELIRLNPLLTVLIICHDTELVETYAQDNYYEIVVHQNSQRSIDVIPLTQKN